MAAQEQPLAQPLEQPNNIIPIPLPSTRSQIAFNKFDEISYTIISNQLETFITGLRLIIPADLLADGRSRFEIRCNNFNYTIKLATKNETLIQILLRTFLEDDKCCYLEINGNIHRSGLYKDLLSLEYDPRSFRQPDDSIRDYMIKWFQNSVSKGWETMIFFGGECTLLGKILSAYSKTQYFYTDFTSIYGDIIRNYRDPLVELIDYGTWRSSIWTCDASSDDWRCCIINTGIHGMGANLASEVCKIGASEIFVISCNTQSWARDWEVLSETYNLAEQVELRTNYSVWIYKLSSF